MHKRDTEEIPMREQRQADDTIKRTAQRWAMVNGGRAALMMSFYASNAEDLALSNRTPSSQPQGALSLWIQHLAMSSISPEAKMAM